MSLSDAQVLIRLLVAVLVGSVFGLERRRRHKPVGRRTHVLICLSCTIVAMISAYGFEGLPVGGMPGDPARLMVGVLTGIGFIGGGIIWKSETGGIQGITTAAEILLLSTLGMAIGLGLYLIAGVGAIIGILTLDGGNIRHKLQGTIMRPSAKQPEGQIDGECQEE